MASYPTAPFFGTRSASPFGTSTTRPRSPIGRWVKAPVDLDTDPGTLALATPLVARYGPLAITIAVGVRMRLVTFMARDISNDDGDVHRYTPAVIATATAWPVEPDALVETLETAGITVSGRLKHWHDLVGNPSREDRRRLVDRDRQRRHRAKTPEPVTRDTVTSRDIGVTSTVTTQVAYKERPRARPSEEKEKETHTRREALRAHEETPATVSESGQDQTVPAPVTILATIWSGPVPGYIARLVADRVRDLPRWQRTVNTWHAAGWHVGPGAVRAMLDRYDRDIDGQRVKDAPSRRRSDRPAAQVAPPAATPGVLPATVVAPQRPPMTDEEFERSRAAFQQARAEFRAKIGAPPSAPPRPVATAPTVPARPVPSFVDLSKVPPADRAATLERMVADLAESRRLSNPEGRTWQTSVTTT